MEIGEQPVSGRPGVGRPLNCKVKRSLGDLATAVDPSRENGISLDYIYHRRQAE
jgi:hypothetical protein